MLQVDELVTIAHSRLTRGLTEAECQQYLHAAECPSSASTVPPSTAGDPSPIPEVGGPEGAFRVTIAPKDFPVPPLSSDDVQFNKGDYTWYLMGGTWRFDQATPDLDDEWSGTYTVSGDRMTFIVGEGDPPCLGERWATHGRCRMSRL